MVFSHTGSTVYSYSRAYPDCSLRSCDHGCRRSPRVLHRHGRTSSRSALVGFTGEELVCSAFASRCRIFFFAFSGVSSASS